MTKLRCFTQDYPHISVFRVWCRTGC